MLEERLLGMRLETEEVDELFGENIVRPDVKPGAGPHLVDVIPRVAACGENCSR